MKMIFNAEEARDQIIGWIGRWFEENGPDCRAVVGISGGKDSSVAAALCAAALGRDRVVGVLMPNGTQADIHVSHALVKHLGIFNVVINIEAAYQGMMGELSVALSDISAQTKMNLAPRLRMSALYAVSQSMNTCNLSEDWVGYSTRYGDAAGDFSPLSGLTVQEVKAVGRALGLPDEFVEKAPSDGLCGKTDEDNLGFTYAVLDRYIRTGEIDDPAVRALIDQRHRANLFKLQPMPAFQLTPELRSRYE